MLNPEYSRKYCCSACIFSLFFELTWKVLSKILHFRKFYDKEVKNLHKNSGGRVRGAEDKVFLFATCCLFSSPIPQTFTISRRVGTGIVGLW